MIVRTSGVLLRFVGYKRQREIDATTVREALNKLVEENPDLGPVLFDTEGNVRRTHHVYLNGDRLDPSTLDRETGPRDEVDILTAVAGG